MVSKNNSRSKKGILVTAGSNYLDIDAYACMVAYAELLKLKGESAAAYSKAPCNYSVPEALKSAGEMHKSLPQGFEDAEYVIVDVSDPGFLGDSVLLERVAEVFDHHTGFESYWREKIGEKAKIEFIGAAATLILREWEKAGLTGQMKMPTARLLAAAILDNTLNLTSQNTTDEDKRAFEVLTQQARAGEDFREEYFGAVQECILENIENALRHDLKTLPDQMVLPEKIAQLCVWNGEEVLGALSDVVPKLVKKGESLLINLIDVKHRCSYFWCDNLGFQKTLQCLFGVKFENNIGKTKVPYLRKEIIKKTFNR